MAVCLREHQCGTAVRWVRQVSRPRLAEKNTEVAPGYGGSDAGLLFVAAQELTAVQVYMLKSSLLFAIVHPLGIPYNRYGI
jgi:hypothetical protein